MKPQKPLIQRWESWVAFLILALPPLTMGTTPIVSSPRGVSIILYVLAALGFFASTFGEKLTRGKNPRERATDVPPTSPTYANENATRPAVKIPLDGPKMLLPWLAFAALGLSACATIPTPPPIDASKYAASLKDCLKRDGLDQLSPEGIKILQILEQGGNSAIQIEQKIENIAVTLSGDTAALVISCAVQSWLNVNPVATGAKPTPSQGAARLFLVRRLPR